MATLLKSRLFLYNINIEHVLIGGAMTYFDSIIGQDSIKNHLSELVSSNALPHSLLFYGEAGLGKLDMAIGLASLF